MLNLLAVNIDLNTWDLLEQEISISEQFPDGTEGSTLMLPANTEVLGINSTEDEEKTVEYYDFRLPDGDEYGITIERMTPGKGWLYPTRVYIEKQ